MRGLSSTRKLVFYFFISQTWRTDEIYKIHFKCLEYYKNCFDEVYFALALENPQDTESLHEVQKKLIEVFGNHKKIEFEIVENTILCECPAFKAQIVDKLGEDDLVFFAHLKGASRTKDKNIVETIMALYYFSLEEEKNENGVTKNLKGWPDYISYGSFPTQFSNKLSVTNKYEWYYACTYYWINTKRLKQYIINNNIEIPEFSDRFYAENFLGNIYPMYSSNAGLYSSYGQKYVIMECENAVNIIWFINDILLTTDEEKEKYNKFKNLILDN